MRAAQGPATDGRNVLVTGTTGSGKTTWTRQQVAGARRLLVWDSLQEWSRKGWVVPVETLRDLQAHVLADLSGKVAFGRLGYVGPASGKHFETWCRLAWVYLRARPGGVIVAEELADVTTPGRAPPAWGEILRKGRHYAASVYGLTQRPAESDKTILGNAALVHCGRMAYQGDCDYMAKVLRIPAREVDALKPLEWIERNMRTLDITRGKVKP